MDHFNEQIVKQHWEGKRIAMVIGAVVVTLALSFVSYLFMPMITVPVLALCGFGLYWLISSQSWEVEYAVTNGDIDIDRIIARRDRKTIVRVRGDKIESLLPVQMMPKDKTYDRVVMAAQSMASATWAFTYHSKKSGSTVVYFEPNDGILENLKKGLSGTVRMDTERALREM